MKTKSKMVLMCLVCLCLAAISKSQAPVTVAKTNGLSLSGLHETMIPGYAYRTYQAPNKTYGYDIFKNGKSIFHQPATANAEDSMALTQQQFAQRAAGMSIEKLHNHMPPALSNDEIKKIITNN
ncbi:MAG TPA: DUF4907 domain-containing protein [Parafilimonas sp.]|nr:DUF4907 domain-containing protein [Parafilimonas sp.]